MSEEDPIQSDDLRTRLHAMETRLRRMRDQRSNHNENAKRAADSRDSVQNQGKELRERIGERLEEQKEVRARAKVHQARRDEIQKQIGELIQQKRGRRDEGNKSVVIELSETVGEIDRIENQIMTDGNLSLKKENRLLKKLKNLISKRDELMPAVQELQVIEIDLGDMEGSIQILRTEADAQHQAMLDANKEADQIWEEIKPMLEERDFLRGEGDRLHSIFLEERAKADEVHKDIVEMLSKVNEIKDELRSQNEQRERTIREHNESVSPALRGPDEDEELADSLSERLLDGKPIKFGGIVSSDNTVQQSSTGRKKRTSRKLGTTRGRKR